MVAETNDLPLLAVSCLANSLLGLYADTHTTNICTTSVTAHVCATVPDDIIPNRFEHQEYDISLFASLQTLKELHVCSGSWVKATCMRSHKSHPARIFATHLHSDSKEVFSTALASPLLAYNLEVPASWAFGSSPSTPTQSVHASSQTILLELEPLLDLALFKGLDQPNLSVASHVTLVKHSRPHISPLELTSSSETHDAEAQSDALVEGLQIYLSPGIRIVARGTTFSVPLPGDLQLVGPPTSGPLAHFTVVDVQPAGQEFLILDTAITNVQLQGGRWRALSPVGHQGFLRSIPSAASEAAGGKAARNPGVHILGEDADAPSHPLPHLRGVGGLLPMWRQVASMLAPLLHPSSLGVEVGASLLLHGPPGSGRRTAVLAAARALGVNQLPISCLELLGNNDEDTLAALRATFERASTFAPCVLLLRDVEELQSGQGGEAPGQSLSTMKIAEELVRLVRRYCSGEARGNVVSRERMLGGFRDGSWQDRDGLVFLVGLSGSREALPAALGRCFTHYLQVDAPSREQHEQLLGSMLAGVSPPSTLQATAQQMAGLLPRDTRGVAADAATLSLEHSLTTQHLLQSHPAPGVSGAPPLHSAAVPQGLHQRVPDSPSATHQVTDAHIGKALEKIRARTATEIGAPQVPSVKWEDIGGLEDVKAAVLDTIELPLKHRELFASGLKRRSGVLLYGPPGSGKTLLAKAVATQCSASFLSVKGPELINMYVGESERQVREIFARARRARPCVLFFDELDSLAPARGASGDSGGVMDRVVAQLLAEIDGVQGGGGDLFVIGATNRPDLLDSALMRPGRLDTLLYVGIAQEPESKLKVLSALTKKFRLADDVDLDTLSRQCPVTLSGADLYALAADAWMLAMRRVIRAQEGNSIPVPANSPPLEEGDDRLEVSMGDFELALRNLTPSLSQEELWKYEQLRAQYESRGGS